MAIVGKIRNGNLVPLLLSEHFEHASPHELAHIMCKWVNGDDEQQKGVVSITIVWNPAISHFVGTVFYWSQR